MCERLQQGGSGTGISVKRERGQRSHSDLGGHNSVWSGETTELRNGEGKRWITDWELESEDKEGG